MSSSRPMRSAKLTTLYTIFPRSTSSGISSPQLPPLEADRFAIPASKTIRSAVARLFPALIGFRYGGLRTSGGASWI